MQLDEVILFLGKWGARIPRIRHWVACFFTGKTSIHDFVDFNEIDFESLSDVDYWRVVGITVVKAIAVWYLLLLSIAATFFIFWVDLILLFFDYSWPLITGLWTWVWGQVVVEWWWNNGNPLGLGLGIALVVIFQIIAIVADSKKEAS